jgi:hypothetical protein
MGIFRRGKDGRYAVRVHNDRSWVTRVGNDRHTAGGERVARCKTVPVSHFFRDRRNCPPQAEVPAPHGRRRLWVEQQESIATGRPLERPGETVEGFPREPTNVLSDNSHAASFGKRAFSSFAKC